MNSVSRFAQIAFGECGQFLRRQDGVNFHFVLGNERESRNWIANRQ